jgi:hypothetical protein
MKRFLLILTFTLLACVGCIHNSAHSDVTCPPPTIQFPLTTTNMPVIPPSSTQLSIIITAFYNHYYNAWISRISLPDIASSSSPSAWTEVSEFRELVKNSLFLPNVVQGLRGADFRLVPVIECITQIDFFTQIRCSQLDSSGCGM